MSVPFPKCAQATIQRYELPNRHIKETSSEGSQEWDWAYYSLAGRYQTNKNTAEIKQNDCCSALSSLNILMPNQHVIIRYFDVCIGPISVRLLSYCASTLHPQCITFAAVSATRRPPPWQGVKLRVLLPVWPLWGPAHLIPIRPLPALILTSILTDSATHKSCKWEMHTLNLQQTEECGHLECKPIFWCYGLVAENVAMQTACTLFLICVWPLYSEK